MRRMPQLFTRRRSRLAAAFTTIVAVLMATVGVAFGNAANPLAELSRHRRHQPQPGRDVVSERCLHDRRIRRRCLDGRRSLRPVAQRGRSRLGRLLGPAGSLVRVPPQGRRRSRKRVGLRHLRAAVDRVRSHSPGGFRAQPSPIAAVAGASPPDHGSHHTRATARTWSPRRPRHRLGYVQLHRPWPTPGARTRDRALRCLQAVAAGALQ